MELFSVVLSHPAVKGHSVVTSSHHVDDLRGLTSQEWADILPVLKDGINKIDKAYHNSG